MNESVTINHGTGELTIVLREGFECINPGIFLFSKTLKILCYKYGINWYVIRVLKNQLILLERFLRSNLTEFVPV